MHSVVSVWLDRRTLVGALTRRDVLARYRGSLLGFMWSVITPLVLLAVYALVFGHVFQVRWQALPESGMGGLAVMLFCGMVPFNFFSETVHRSSQCIVAAPNFVKRVAFPVEILPLVTLLGALVHALIGCLVLAGGVWWVQGGLPWTWLWLPVVWLPMVMVSAAVSLWLSGVGVFIRDTGHAAGLALLVIMFLSPVFYPDAMVPPRLQILMYINPLANLISNLRKICVLGTGINWGSWALLLAAGILFFALASAWFVRVKRRFPDVL